MVHTIGQVQEAEDIGLLIVLRKRKYKTRGNAPVNDITPSSILLKGLIERLSSEKHNILLLPVIRIEG